MNYLSKQFAEKQARNDLFLYARTVGNLSIKFPVEPEHVAEVLWDTDVCFVEEKYFEGSKIAQADLGSNKIIVGVCDCEQRIRFSTAHEVGHISLHRYLLKAGELDKEKEIFHEYQANAYAASMLMPKELVLKVIERNTGLLDDDEYRIISIAREFDVSRQAARFRLQDMNLVKNNNARRDVERYDKSMQSKREEWFASLSNDKSR